MAHTYTSPHHKAIMYYPSPVSRVCPDWVVDFEIGLVGGEKEALIGQLLVEVYAAVRGGQYRLATMGVRSLLEQVMIANVGDHQKFRKNLEQFYSAGYISLMQRDTLDDLLEAGHAVTHRFFNPSEEDLKILLDITEGILEAIYIHPSQAESLSKKVSPRILAASIKKASA